MSIPEDVIERAELSLTDARIAFAANPDNYARSMDDAQIIAALAPTIAAWARNEALREAAETARTTTLTLDDVGYETEAIAYAILDLVKEHITIPNPDHTPLGKYEVID